MVRGDMLLAHLDERVDAPRPAESVRGAPPPWYWYEEQERPGLIGEIQLYEIL